MYMFNVLYESGNKETIKICTYESEYALGWLGRKFTM